MDTAKFFVSSNFMILLIMGRLGLHKNFAYISIIKYFLYTTYIISHFRYPKNFFHLNKIENQNNFLLYIKISSVIFCVQNRPLPTQSEMT